MDQVDRTLYICPMHGSEKQAGPGKCHKCGMDLVPEGTRFALLRHMAGSPKHLAAMAGLMILIMAGVMMVIPKKGY